MYCSSDLNHLFNLKSNCLTVHLVSFLSNHSGANLFNVMSAVFPIPSVVACSTSRIRYIHMPPEFHNKAQLFLKVDIL